MTTTTATRRSTAKTRMIKFLATVTAALVLLVVNPKVHWPTHPGHWNQTAVTLKLSS